MPTVSVIVPNYCHAPYLEQRIESILQQTFQDFELILLDDCSTDGSREILERYRNHPKFPAFSIMNGTADHLSNSGKRGCRKPRAITCGSPKATTFPLPVFWNGASGFSTPVRIAA